MKQLCTILLLKYGIRIIFHDFYYQLFRYQFTFIRVSSAALYWSEAAGSLHTKLHQQTLTGGTDKMTNNSKEMIAIKRDTQMKSSNYFFSSPSHLNVSPESILRDTPEPHQHFSLKSDPFSILKVQHPQPYLPSQGLSLSSLQAVSMHCLFAEIFLYLLEDLLLQAGCVILLQHIVLSPRFSPLLSMLHHLWGQTQVKADSLNVKLGTLPAFRPWLWLHFYF